MTRLLTLQLLLALAGCAAEPRPPVTSPCAEGEASYACQVERYHNVAN